VVPFDQTSFIKTYPVQSRASWRLSPSERCAGVTALAGNTDSARLQGVDRLVDQLH
jgi:hypothetical protein